MFISIRHGAIALGLATATTFAFAASGDAPAKGAPDRSTPQHDAMSKQDASAANTTEKAMCKAMTGDEKRACMKDARKSAKTAEREGRRRGATDAASAPR
jgi:hypothetical protein